jgi:hypothetical protein
LRGVAAERVLLGVAVAFMTTFLGGEALSPIQTVEGYRIYDKRTWVRARPKGQGWKQNSR